MKIALTTICAGVLVAVVACTRDDPVAPNIPHITSGPSFDLFVQPPGEGGRLCFAYLDGPAFGGNWWDPRGSNCRTQMHPSPLSSLFHDADTGPYDVIADFSEPVSNLVITPLGPWMCGGDPGSFTVSTASGESVTFAMPTPDESDCDRVVYVHPGQECSDYSIIRSSIPQGVPVGVADIVRVVIHPNSPLHFTEYSYQNDGTCGFIEIPHERRASTTYILAFREFEQASQGLALDCEPATVVRGQSVTCRARTEPPGGAFQITAWRFIANDAALGVIARDASEATQETWSGPMVASGTVTVDGRVDGTARSANAIIAVTPRDWSHEPADFEIVQDDPGELPARPTIVHQLGSMTPASHITPKSEFIQSGPNTRLTFHLDRQCKHNGSFVCQRVCENTGSAPVLLYNRFASLHHGGHRQSIAEGTGPRR